MTAIDIKITTTNMLIVIAAYSLDFDCIGASWVGADGLRRPVDELPELDDPSFGI
jgi:hypothetical protein